MTAGGNEMKCAIVVSDDLEVGLAANAASVLSVTLGHRIDGLVGEDVKDADGAVHPGVIYIPLPVLRANRPKLVQLMKIIAVDDECFFASFTGLAQSCRTYDEFVGKMGETPTADLDLVGLAVYGPRKKINRLVGAMPLMR